MSSVPLFFFFLTMRRPPRSTLFPTRRSSDLAAERERLLDLLEDDGLREQVALPQPVIDRKSTRLNSSHRCISYAVFCLKKKKKESNTREQNNTYKTPHTYTNHPEIRRAQRHQ